MFAGGKQQEAVVFPDAWRSKKVYIELFAAFRAPVRLGVLGYLTDCAVTKDLRKVRSHEASLMVHVLVHGLVLPLICRCEKSRQ